jgi:CRP-like cAMP-binding protein
VALKHDIAILETIPFFAALGLEPLRLVAFSAETRKFRDGDVLFRKGDASDGGYVVMSGMVVLQGEGDNQPATIAGPGTLIGELALIIDTERPATATVRDTASVLRIPRNTFHRVLEEFPETAETIRALMVEQAQATATRLAGVRYDLLAIDRAEAKRRG